MKFKVGDIVLPSGKMRNKDYDVLAGWLEAWSPLGIGKVDSIDGEVVLLTVPYKSSEDIFDCFFEEELILIERRKNGKRKCTPQGKR